jgi:hypothetical protein
VPAAGSLGPGGGVDTPREFGEFPSDIALEEGKSGKRGEKRGREVKVTNDRVFFLKFPA